LTIQFFQNRFVDDYDPTIEGGAIPSIILRIPIEILRSPIADCYHKHCLLDEELVSLEVLDTAGQDDYT
jgi:GTPase KRas